MIKMYSDYFESLVDDIPEIKTLIKKKPKVNASEQLWLALASMKGQGSPPQTKEKAPADKQKPNPK